LFQALQHLLFGCCIALCRRSEALGHGCQQGGSLLRSMQQI
jgi:hypothetical protein